MPHLPRFLSASLLALAAVPAMAQEGGSAPSFLVIIADDLGYRDVGYLANDATTPPTPRMDQLAASGVAFRRAYANPLCSPTRASILTGLHPWSHGVGRNAGSQVGMDLQANTLAHELGDSWRRVALGKWHLTHKSDLVNDPFTQLGFDEFRGYYRNLDNFGQSHDRWWKLDGLDRRVSLTYATSDTVNDAIHELDTGTEPLFLWVSLANPHSPFHQAPAHLSRPADSGLDPDLFRTQVEATDTEVGRLIDALDASSYADNTYVFFLSDNGTPQSAARPPLIATRVKSSAYEGGIHVPMVVRGPGVSPRVSSDLVQMSDLFATIIDLAGGTGSAPHSRSFKSILDGGAGSRSYVYLERYSVNAGGNISTWARAAVGQRYKLLHASSHGYQFYDLLKDGLEQNDLLAGFGNLSPSEQQAHDALRAVLDAQGASLYP